MKLKRLTKPPMLWQFMKVHLPVSLKASRITDGYGGTYHVKIRLVGWRNLFEDSVAIITENKVEIFHPQYFSDIEKIVKDYEDMTGLEVTVELWEKFPLKDNKKDVEDEAEDDFDVSVKYCDRKTGDWRS